MTTATLITRDATLDDLSVQDYADIWTELRQNHSLRACIDLMQSSLSAASWQQYEKGERTLSRQMRNDLRRPFAHLTQLPLTVAEATAQASPDAAVWQVGEGVPTTVVMLGDDPVILHVNGAVTVMQECPVTRLTLPQVQRKYIPRPYASKTQHERLQRLKLHWDDISWSDIIEAGLKEFEA